MSENRPAHRTEAITVQAAGAETMLYEELRHQAFCLDAATSAVWRLADGTRTRGEIALAAGLDEPAVAGSLAALAGHGLLTSPAGPAVSRRQMLAHLRAGAALAVPGIAMIAAPRAAQAYNGCVDCANSASPERRKQHVAEQQQMQEQKSRQQGMSFTPEY